MAYHVYIPLIKKILYSLRSPSLLEIGLDGGQTFVPLSTFLVRTKQCFNAMGIDVRIQEIFNIIMSNIDVAPEQRLQLVQENSLYTLPKLIESGSKFDVILLDGDHNYYTVSRELELLTKLAPDNCVMFCDDYHGKWSEKDQWYSLKEEWKDAKDVTQVVDTQKHGVKTAIDEFLLANNEWRLEQPVRSEAVILVKGNFDVR